MHLSVYMHTYRQRGGSLSVFGTLCEVRTEPIARHEAHGKSTGLCYTVCTVHLNVRLKSIYVHTVTHAVHK